MLAISIQQPWAEMILDGKKTIDIRKGYTKHRGILIIHAAWIRNAREFKKATIDYKLKEQYQERAIVGIVNLKDVIKLTDELWEELRPQHLLPGKWIPNEHKHAWIFENPIRIRPITYNGLPKIFPINDAVAKEIMIYL